MNLIYEKCGDYLIPNLIPDPEPEQELRKFGLMRKSYLEDHREGVTERLKAQDQMLWVGKMNNIRARAEEIVLCEIVYR